MDYHSVSQLKQHHTALRLLNADLAPLIISFLHRTFIQTNARSVRESELIDRLDDYLHRLRQVHGPVHPRTAKQYLDDWTSGESAYLRKYYPNLNDEPEYDLNPGTEKAIEWLISLEQKQFVGTESRLLTVFQLLRDIVQATEQDPLARIKELEKRKAEVDQEIAKLQSGILDPYSPTQVKERFLQAEETARRLLSDFRQVEENFRLLDHQTRERIATSASTKGELLDEIFGQQNAISDSDQGRTFRAFWSFLMSPARQEELEELVDKSLSIKEIKALKLDELLPQIKFRLMEAGERIQRTSATLIEQLRRYLDDQVWLENKRIMNIIQGIEKQAVSLREHPPQEKAFWEIPEFKPSIELPMSRSLYKPPQKLQLDSSGLEIGESIEETDLLFSQTTVDEAILRANIRHMLQERSQVSLLDVVAEYPITRGLAEVVTYLHIAAQDPRALINAAVRESLDFTFGAGTKEVQLPMVIFTRGIV